jgi:hypothetical protein
LENDGGSCGAYIGAIRLGQADPVTRLSEQFWQPDYSNFTQMNPV